MTGSMWTWPATIIASAGAISLAVMCGASPVVRVSLALWFLLVCPGMAVVRLLRISDRSSEFALAVACSLGIEAILATTMVYAGLWSPPGGLALPAAQYLPEVADWSRRVRRRLGSALPVCKAERTPEDCQQDGDDRLTWTFYFGEKQRKRIVFWRRFRVDAVSGEILVQDPGKNTYITLEEWRKANHAS